MAVMSGGLGIFLGYLGTRFLAAFTQTNLPQVADIPMDLRVLSFTVAISVLSGILFGLTPSLQLSRPNLGGTLSDEGRGSTGSRRRNRVRSVLVAAQVALSMVLLIGSGLLIRSFMRLRMVDPGFGAKNTLTAQDVPSAGHLPATCRSNRFLPKRASASAIDSGSGISRHLHRATRPSHSRRSRSV